jgi:hypothetical protein
MRRREMLMSKALPEELKENVARALYERPLFDSSGKLVARHLVGGLLNKRVGISWIKRESAQVAAGGPPNGRHFRVMGCSEPNGHRVQVSAVLV